MAGGASESTSVDFMLLKFGWACVVVEAEAIISDRDALEN